MNKRCLCVQGEGMVFVPQTDVDDLKDRLEQAERERDDWKATTEDACRQWELYVADLRGKLEQAERKAFVAEEACALALEKHAETLRYERESARLVQRELRAKADEEHEKVEALTLAGDGLADKILLGECQGECSACGVNRAALAAWEKAKGHE